MVHIFPKMVSDTNFDPAVGTTTQVASPAAADEPPATPGRLGGRTRRLIRRLMCLLKGRHDMLADDSDSLIRIVVQAECEFVDAGRRKRP